jgi:hypothetical protein
MLNSKPRKGGNMIGHNTTNRMEVLGILFLGVSAFSGTASDTNLVAWYPLDGNAQDSSGRGNHGTTISVSWGADRQGQANSAFWLTNAVGSFPTIVRATQYISVPDIPSLRPTNGLTLMAWIYLLPPSPEISHAHQEYVENLAT